MDILTMVMVGGVFLSVPAYERISEAGRAKFTETDASCDSNP